MKVEKRIIKIIREYDELLYGVGGKYCTLVKKYTNKEMDKQERITLGKLKSIYNDPFVLFPDEDTLLENGANEMDLELLKKMLLIIKRKDNIENK